MAAPRAAMRTRGLFISLAFSWRMRVGTGLLPETAGHVVGSTEDAEALNGNDSSETFDRVGWL